MAILSINMGRKNRITITNDVIDKLKKGKNRTGLAGRALLRGMRGSYPDGLRAGMVDGWRTGIIKTAKPRFLEWVLTAYENWEEPSLPKPPPEKIALTTKRRRFIQAEVKRTGLSAVHIMRHAPRPLPPGLNHQKVQRWITGNTQTAIKEHWELVLNLYSSMKS